MAKVSSHRPSAAGYFYPDSGWQLERMLADLLPRSRSCDGALAAVVPHGSLAHAGSVIVRTLSRIRVPATCILLGPAHAYSAFRWSIMEAGGYDTPLGRVAVDSAVSRRLRHACAFLEPDHTAQAGEHALEVPLTVLQWMRPDGLSVVPIVASQDDALSASVLSAAIAELAQENPGSVLVLASVDFAQFVGRAAALEQTAALLEPVKDLDANGLWRRIEEKRVQPCGAGLLACVLEFAKRLDARAVEIAGIDTSADHGGDPDSAFGYAGVIIR